jgi:HEAT repeat protein
VLLQGEGEAPFPTPDSVLQRLSGANTGPEKCTRLSELEAGEDPQVAEAITAVLEDTRLVSVRVCATQALGNQRAPVAHSWLTSLANDPEPEVHSAALDILAASDAEQDQAVAVEATHDDDPDIRLSAVNALLKAGREQAFTALAAVLPSIEDRATLDSLITALGASPDARALPVLDSLAATADRDSHLSALSALAASERPVAAPRLWALLEMGSEQEFGIAVNGLLAPARAPLILKLRSIWSSGSPERRTWALAQLLRLDIPDRERLMAEVLRSGELGSKSLVVQELMQKPDASFEAQLIALAQVDEQPLNSQVLYALTQLDTPSARAAVVAVDEKSPSRFRHHLGKPPRGRDETREQLIAQLQSADPEAADTLPSLAADHDPSAQEAARSYVESHQTADNLRRFVTLASADHVQRLLARTGRLDVEQQRAVVSALSQRGEPQFADVLRPSLQAGDPETRASALRGLLSLGDDMARSELEHFAQHTNATDRALAAELLGIGVTPAANAQLEALAQDSDPDVVSAALHALEHAEPEQVQRFAERAFRAAAPEGRAALLGSIGDLRSNVTRPLYELAVADTEDSAAIQGIQALTNLAGPESARQLLTIASDVNRSPEVRQEAAGGLKQLGGALARSNRALLDSLSPTADPGAISCNLGY